MSGVETAGIVVGSITAIGVFIGPILANRWQEQKRKQKEALSNHFQEFADGILIPWSDQMARLRNVWDELMLSSKQINRSWEGRLSLERADLEEDKLYASFKLHFPSEADRIETFRNNLVRHHENHDRFSEELDKLVKERTGLPVTVGGQPPFIYERTPELLRHILQLIARNEPLTDDFRRAEIKEGEFWTLGIGPTGYAVTLTEEEGQNCKSKLIELTEYIELQERESQIFANAVQLENDSKQLAEHLDFLCQKHIKFGSALKKISACHICRVIPGKSLRKLFSKR